MNTYKHALRGLAMLICSMTLALSTMAQEAKSINRVLFTNVNVFDGVNEKRIENASVLVELHFLTSV